MLSINPMTKVTHTPQRVQFGCCDNPNCTCNAKNEQDSFIKHQGILPPKDYKPDPYAGLGPKKELTREERLMKSWENFQRPMYAVSEHVQTTVEPVGDKMQAYTVKTVQVITPKDDEYAPTLTPEKPSFKQRVKNFFKKIFHIK